MTTQLSVVINDLIAKATEAQTLIKHQHGTTAWHLLQDGTWIKVRDSLADCWHIRKFSKYDTEKNKVMTHLVSLHSPTPNAETHWRYAELLTSTEYDLFMLKMELVRYGAYHPTVLKDLSQLAFLSNPSLAYRLHSH
jgi:hypothetical protein